jgi:hypothetical protein
MRTTLLVLSLFIVLGSLVSATPRVRVVHAISGAPNVAFFANQYPTGVTNIGFTQVSDYITLAPGVWTLKLTTATSSSTPGANVVNVTVELVSHTTYSLIALSNKGQPSLSLKVDDNTPPRPKFATIRFIHLAVTSPSVPVNVALNGAEVFLNYNFGQASAYQTVPAGPYNLDITVADDEGSLLTSVPSVDLQSRTVYTLYALGNGQVFASLSADHTATGADACALCPCQSNGGTASSNSEVNLVFEDLLPAQTSCCKGFKAAAAAASA